VPKTLQKSLYRSWDQLRARTIAVGDHVELMKLLAAGLSGDRTWDDVEAAVMEHWRRMDARVES
jgi:hypothetical protein